MHPRLWTRPFVSLLTVLALAGTVEAAPIFAPSDFILGGASDGTRFEVGEAGFDSLANNWPGNEGPEHMIDGVGQKYLNFAGDENMMAGGAIVTPSGGSSIAQSLTLWAANDEIPRDPSSYQLYGTNQAITAANAGDTMLLSAFTLIASGDVFLPSSRNAGGNAPLLDPNSFTVTFLNTNAYTSYLVLFPTLKDAMSANSMQIAEVQLDSVAAVPEPTSLVIFGLGLLGIGLAKRRSRT